MRQDKMTMTDYDIQNRLSQIEHFLLEFKEMVNWDKVKKYLEPLDPLSPEFKSAPATEL